MQIPPYPVESNRDVSETDNADTDMTDAGDIPTQQELSRNTPDLPPRQHSDTIAHQGPAVTSSFSERSFSVRYELLKASVTKSEYKQVHSECYFPKPRIEPREELEHGPATPDVPSTAPEHEAEGLSDKVELELRQRIEELEFLLEDAPSPSAVQELQRALERETALHQQTVHTLRQKASEADETRKRWKQAARELDKFRSQGQGFYQVTDNYLIELTTQLRYNIRNFAIQYFSGDLAKKPKFDEPKLWQKYMAATTPGSLDFETYLSSSERRPSVIQAFLWRFLVGVVFDHFRWAGDSAISFRNMCLTLRPQGQYWDCDLPVNPEAERKFQVWVATTTGLVLEAIESTPSTRIQKSIESKIGPLVTEACDTIDPFLSVRDGSHVKELHRIVDEAMRLDKEISRQVARVEWGFPRPGKELIFDPATMQLENSAKPSPGNQEVQLAICPSMKKRGKSTGEDFKSEVLLLPMEVFC